MPTSARAYCDATGGPIATTATGALDIRNVNLILPFAPAQAEPELSAAFKQVFSLREMGSDAKGLADRYFVETAVRPSPGEGALYTGSKLAGTDFGPAIPAVENAPKIGTWTRWLTAQR